jgi:glutamate racemase
VLACNTASAKALRTIQRQDVPHMDAEKRVLGVIRPTAEVVGAYTKSRSVGVLGTKGTVNSNSYLIEINKFFPDVKVHQLACPMWVPIVEYGEYRSEGADYFVQKYLDKLLSRAPDIDTILLACTHYPLLMDKIKKYIPDNIKVVAQGEIVANSLEDYLQRHSEIEAKVTKNGSKHFYTTDSPTDFNEHASIFFGQPIESEHLHV